MGEEEQTHDKRWIPVLGNVVAGLPTEAIENFDDDWEELSEDMMNDGYEYFALRIKGDSMSPRMQNGDVVIVRKQNDIESDEIAVVRVDGDDATVKKVRLTDDGIWLLPSNPAYTPMFYSKGDEVSIL
jgi:repressor LexA